MLRPEFVLSFGLVLLSGCKGCVEQHDPTEDWKLFAQESAIANQVEVKLTDEGALPEAPEGGDVAADPVAQKYSQFCASCHGETGAGDGPAGTGLVPAPRNFVTWDDDVSDEHIATVIVDGGPAVGLSPAMAPWGSVLSDEEVDGLVKMIREFRDNN